ncbi:MAG: hypothetical protein Q7T48_09930 [Cellvibrio sp.]|uniref:hypothetical protein n=1 Tax=Cellvibrio sp. TaxID=1965322 RepID=UPI0027213CA1|nr:hypothetical protein [Cellvibrio sp.]
MQTILRWAVRCLAIVSIVASLPASAYLQFTYTSQQLPLTSYLIEEWPQDLFDPPLPPPAFTLSFRAPEQDLSLQPLTNFRAENFAFSLISPDADYIYYPVDIDPTSYGQVSLDRAGMVAGWNLMVQMTELITPDTDMLVHEMSDHQIRISSNSETGDQLTLRFHPTTWHRHWIQLAQLEFTFADISSGNWTIEKVSVPEPRLATLLMVGLLVLLWSRQKNKKALDDGQNQMNHT